MLIGEKERHERLSARAAALEKPSNINKVRLIHNLTYITGRFISNYGLIRDNKVVYRNLTTPKGYKLTYNETEVYPLVVDATTGEKLNIINNNHTVLWLKEILKGVVIFEALIDKCFELIVYDLNTSECTYIKNCVYIDTISDTLLICNDSHGSARYSGNDMLLNLSNFEALTVYIFRIHKNDNTAPDYDEIDMEIEFNLPPDRKQEDMTVLMITQQLELIDVYALKDTVVSTPINVVNKSNTSFNSAIYVLINNILYYRQY